MADAESHYRNFLAALGFTGDEELGQTPEKVSELFREFAPKTEPPSIQVLPTESNEPVVLGELPFYSLCAHHLVPFFGHAKIAYLPSKRIAGFGCIVRSLHHFARQPQLQERLGEQLTSYLQDTLGARAVLVELKSRQMCMEMRGVKSTGEVRTLHRKLAESVRPDSHDLRLLEKLVYG